MPDAHVHVIHRNQRWEVAIDGVTRPVVDWFFSKDRAIASALEDARALGVAGITVQEWDGTIDEWVTVEGERVSRISQVA